MRSKFVTTHITSLIAFVLVLAASAWAQQPVKWPHGKKAAIVFTYDDSLHSHLDIAIPQLNEVGFKGTFFLNGTFPPEDVSRWRAVAAAGHSLGEYSAYIAAGALAPTDAAALVRRRGELMQQAGTERPGTMAAVLGLATAEVEAACRAASSGGAVVVAANLNAPDQTVISGDPDAVAKAGAACKARGAKRVVPLKVSGAFHSSLMAPAANHLRVALEHAPFQKPAFPVIANATAEPVRDATRARRLLADQLTAPVRWVTCMQRAAELAGADARFIEVGPGNVLAGLLRRIVPGASVTSLGTADEVATFLEAA